MDLAIAVKQILLLSFAVILRGSFAAAQDGAGIKILLPIRGEMLRGVSKEDVTDAYHGTLLAQARHPPRTASSSPKPFFSTPRAELLKEESSTTHLIFDPPIAAKDDSQQVLAIISNAGTRHPDDGGVDTHHTAVVAANTSETSTTKGMAQLFRGSSHHFAGKNPKEEKESIDATSIGGRALSGSGLTVRIITATEADNDSDSDKFTIGTATDCLKTFKPLGGKGGTTTVTLNAACPLKSSIPLTLSTSSNDGWGIAKVEVQLDDGTWKEIASNIILDNDGGIGKKSYQFYMNKVFADVCVLPIENGGDCRQDAKDCHCDDGLSCYNSECSPLRKAGESCSKDADCESDLSCEAQTCKTPSISRLKVRITTGTGDYSVSGSQFRIGTTTDCLKTFTPTGGKGGTTTVTLNPACPLQSSLPLTMSATGDDGWRMDKVEVQLDGGTWKLIASNKILDNNDKSEYKSHQFYLNNVIDDVCFFPIKTGGDCEQDANDCHCHDGLSCEANECNTPAGNCLKSTEIIMEAVDSSYNDTAATWHAVTAVERTITDDFTTNQVYNSIYESACVTAGGTYEELTYKAKCNQAGGDEITLHVIGQPRCYAKSCAAAIESDVDFANELLYKFTLVPTAERAREKHDSTLTWTCTGALNDALTNINIGTTGCGVATDLMNTQTPSLLSATMGMIPAVSDTKFLFLIPTKGKKVQYKGEETAALKTECGKVSGVFMEKDFKMTCTTGAGSGGSEATFEVTDFPLCLASVCKTDQAAIDGAIDIQFKDEMFVSEHLDETQDWTCIGSGAVMAASIRVSVGTVLLALWWCLI